MDRFAAFISYSHADTRVAAWLHRALEGFRVPRALVGTPTPLGPAPRRLLPVFRDRDELPASGDLGTELRAALAASRFQIVLCSPRAATSRWVNEEILSFKRVHGDTRVLALIVSGEPGAEGLECFPPALRFKLGDDGALSTTPAEPIAADLRAGKDGRRLALLKLLAGLTGLKLDQLVRRDEARRRQRLVAVACGASLVAASTGALAVYANSQRAAAERQRRLADASLDFLVGTFAVANPATENPRTITAITILNRVSRRAAGELAREPAVAARLLGATGDIYANLGLGREAERDLRAALRLQSPNGAARADTLLKLALVALERTDMREAEASLDSAARAFDADDAAAPLLGARIADTRARIAYAQGRDLDAARGLATAIALYERAGGDQRPAIGRAMMKQGAALGQAGRFKRSLDVFARAERLFTALYGPIHVETARATQNRAAGAMELGDLDGAAMLARRALRIYRRVLDPDHPTIADMYLLLGRIDLARASSPRAAEAFEQARAMFARIYGPENAAVGDAQYYLAEAQSDGGHHAQALATLESTRRIYTAAYGALHPEQAGLLETRAQIRRAAGDAAGAARDCAASLAMRARIDPGAPERAAARAHCAMLLADPPRASLRFADAAKDRDAS